jgi:hypothetical protein
MKKLLLLTILLFFLSATHAAAIGIVAYNTNDAAYDSNVAAWILSNGGNTQLIEDFEGETLGWYGSLSTSVGVFTAGGSAGTGASSYKNSGVSGANATDVKFSITSNTTWLRTNTTPGGSQWLDSADITQLTLDLTIDVTNLYFFLSDPSDVGATTKANAGDATNYAEWTWDDQPNGSLWFVGITSAESIGKITWTTDNTNDGFGLDDFTTVSVPEPANLLFLGTGLICLAGMSRKRVFKR